LRRLTEVAVTLTDRRLILPVVANGIPLNFMLDTGAESAIITPQTVERLKLPLDAQRKVKLQALGGEISVDRATLDTLTVGDVSLSTHAAGIGQVPDVLVDGKPIAGIVGSDFLTHYDVDLDVPSRRLAIYQARNCRGSFVPWRPPFAGVAADWQGGLAELSISVRLDGRPASAIFDTGAPYSVISRASLAWQVGVPMAVVEAERPIGVGTGLDRRQLALSRHVFDTMTVGNLVFHHVAMGSLATSEMAVDMLIGMDFISQHRIWLSPSSTQVFIAPH
jgi:predicted aspartyl protease